MAEQKKRRARRGDPLPETTTLVLRGDLLDPEELWITAERNFDVYGFYGISVFAEVGSATFDTIAAHEVLSELLARFLGARHRTVRNEHLHSPDENG